MKNYLLVFLLGVTASWVNAQERNFDPDPGAALPVEQQQNTSFNPDPGAALGGGAPQPAFYQPPAGTTPDYAQHRDPLLDAPHAPVLPVNVVSKVWKVQPYADAELAASQPNTVSFPDRWDYNIPKWMRYNTPNQETPYADFISDGALGDKPEPRIWDPYKQSLLKGDIPILGQDLFLSMTATSFTSYEARDLPTPAGVSTNVASSSEFFGQGDQQEVDQFLTMNFNFFQGETAFQPIAWQIHLEPVYNINYFTAKENGILSANPTGSNSQSDNSGVFTNNGNGNPNGVNQPAQTFVPAGTQGVGNTGSVPNSGSTGVFASGNQGLFDPNNPFGVAKQTNPNNNGDGFTKAGPAKLGDAYTSRTEDFLALQTAFVEFKLADLTDNYDFVSLRVGNQPFISDFRGFVFNDTNLGARLFGNYDNNLYQYNLAAFNMRQKDTYSGLNTFDSRNQWVLAANVYRQDCFFPGYTGQVTFLANLDNGNTHYDRTGLLVTPEVLGTVANHQVKSYYFGWNGDGHIGRFNITHSVYEVIGTDDLNGLAGHRANINAQMAALELSYDVDWIRYKASFFYASGSNHPTGNTINGFDSILDNPNFIGGPFSYYVRQGFVLGDTAANIKQGNSLLLDLRSSKTEGQSNFDNPGVIIAGLGTDMDLLPNTKLFLNANYIAMADTASVNYALHSDDVNSTIGWDLSGGIQYRPLLTNNIIISAGLGALLPGSGYKAIYRTITDPVPGYTSEPAGHVDAFLYSGFASLTLTY